jgi:hypothetical protein
MRRKKVHVCAIPALEKDLVCRVRQHLGTREAGLREIVGLQGSRASDRLSVELITYL